VKRKRRWTKAWLVILAAIVALAGCGGPAEDPEPEPMPEPEPQVVQTPVEPEPEPEPEPVYPYVYPLTGIGTEELLEERPLLMLIENHRDARPQSGLIDADIVYEILAEGEITRFAAVFHSEKPEVIGPIRSLRPYYAQIGEAVDALIVHAGYSPAALEYVQKKKLDHFDEIYNAGAYFWRSKERKAPHNLYTSTELIRKGMGDKKVRSEWHAPAAIPFAAKDAVITGETAETVLVEYYVGYKVEYVYDAGKGTFLRHMAGSPHLDKESGEQIEAANVMIIKTSHRVLDDVGRREVNIYGPGEGWLVQQGKAREIEWKLVDGLIRPYINGEEVALVPGKTWVQVISPNLKVTFSAKEGESSTAS
jgi:predicted small lipoprotein YifL